MLEDLFYGVVWSFGSISMQFWDAKTQRKNRKKDNRGRKYRIQVLIKPDPKSRVRTKNIMK